jgi:hypothetical protein
MAVISCERQTKCKSGRWHSDGAFCTADASSTPHRGETAVEMRTVREAALSEPTGPVQIAVVESKLFESQLIMVCLDEVYSTETWKTHSSMSGLSRTSE